MRELGIKAQWIKPWTTTTGDSDFSEELHNILDKQFNPECPNAVWCTDITYIWTQAALYTLIALWTCLLEKLSHGHFLTQWKYPPLLKLLIKQRPIEKSIPL